MGSSRWFVIMALCIGIFSLSTVAWAQEATPVPFDDTAEDIVDTTVDAAEETAEEIDNFVDRLVSSPQTDVARVLMVLGGIILLVAGWRIYDFIVLVAGFLIGASIAVSLVTDQSEIIEIAAFLIGGVLGAILGAVLYFFAVFVIGAYIGVVLTSAAATALDLTPISDVALLVAAIIGGLILIALSFEFLVLFSAIVGAQMLSLGLGLGAGWTLLFAIAGVIIQFGLMRALKYDFRRRSNRGRFRVFGR